jgi:hypothetical protein
MAVSSTRSAKQTLRRTNWARSRRGDSV